VGLRGRVQAVLVDWTAVLGERGGVGDLRRRLLSGARGRVIEIGAGTGANLRHYPRDLERLVLVEPVEEMARRIEERLAATGRTASVVRARAEDLPVEDASFDTAVATLVLCSVREPARALAEIRRVLVPGGQLLFLEHVRSCAVRLAGWQDRVNPLWRAVAFGCNLNRPTLASIEAAGFVVAELERGRMPAAPPVLRPLVLGRAVR